MCYKHDQAVDPNAKHDSILVGAVLWDLDERRKRNGPEQEQDVGDLVNPRQSRCQQQQPEGCNRARKGAGNDEPWKTVSEDHTKQGVAKNKT